MTTTDKSELHETQIDASKLKSGGKDDTSIGSIAGYAVVWNTPSDNLPFTEIIKTGALDNVDTSKTLALYNHDFANVLGRVDAGTLRLTPDEHGLHFNLDIPDTSLGHDVYNQIKNGNLKGLSFRFTIAEGGENWKNINGKPTRIISKIATMREISVVAIPAYDATSIEVTRSFKEFTNTTKQKMLLALETYDLEV